MTQIKEGLSKADPKPMLIRMVEESNLSTDKKPSPELFSLIKAAATNLLGFGELWGSIKKKGHDEGFSEKELQDMLRPFLKEKLDSKKVWYLFHKEEQIERVQKKQEENRTKFSMNDAKKVLEIRDSNDRAIAKHLGIDDKLGLNKDSEPEEDPLKIENEFLKEKVAELEDALRKTEQFKPANKLTEEQAKDMVMEVVKQTGLAVPLPNVDSILDWLKKSADGSHSFYYDTYGIDLFKNRELSQLKNSGVKVFKRLYFEV
jgi:hypothetical protein